MKNNCSKLDSFANDSVCLNLSLQRELAEADPAPIVDPTVFTTIYNDESRFHINGTLLVVNFGASSVGYNDGAVVVMLNNNPNTQYTIEPDKSMAKTFSDIRNIKVGVTSFPLGQTGNYEANLQVSFSLNYKY